MINSSFFLMVRGIDTDSKHKHKKRGFWWKFKDMFDNKRAMQSYCNRVGTNIEEKEKNKKKEVKK